MSPDWGWVLVIALAIPPALGHLYHAVLLVNLVSSLGFREALLDRLRALLFLGLCASLVLLTMMHLRAPWWAWPWPWRGYALLCLVSGCVIGPLACLRLALRRQPPGVTGWVQTHDLAEATGAESLIGTGRGSWMLRLPRNESLRLSVRDWDLAIPRLPEPIWGLQILQLSDLHCAPCYDRRFLEAVVERCGSSSTDLVVITGDLIEHEDAISWIEPVLGRLDARIGKFAILGNHDLEHKPGEIKAALERAGFEVLDGRWTTVYVDGTTVALGGTTAPWGPALDAREIPPADFRILLSHTPDLFYRAAEWGIDLMLAGHNHGGQIRFPLIGPVFMPSRFSRRLDRGFFQKRKTLLYVSEGVGGMHPVRYGCPPEVARFILRAEQKNEIRPILAHRLAR
jgi:predicted MPP superfamily phosphohydrolase